ncbi:hypothetical protein RTCIAT899_PB02650 (plasmid) [Rhizobium tropici CIAT 899]|nr:hypothetical protein RTCIAT899_PB02650 [Rhizobium tropici CIAT 899]
MPKTPKDFLSAFQLFNLRQNEFAQQNCVANPVQTRQMRCSRRLNYAFRGHLVISVASRLSTMKSILCS